MKHLIWIGAILALELMTFRTVQEFWEARSIVPGYNAVKVAAIETSPKGIKPTVKTERQQAHTFWSLPQGFCVGMHGLARQTRDGWIYPVRPASVVPLIQAGVIKRTDFRVWEIEDWAKADSLAKAFTMP